MTRKTQAAYSHLFKNLDGRWKLRPVCITTDFEKGLRNALKKQYPAARLIGCWFHFSQALRRRAKTIKNFLIFLKSNKDARKLFRKFTFLPLLREDKIVMAFTLFKDESRIFGSRFNDFVKYVEDQWIVKEGPTSFCVYMLPDRTNNLLESFNSNLNSKIPTSGSFFKFIELLRSEELTTSADYAKIKAGGAQVYSKKSNKYVESNKFIIENQHKFEKGQLSVLQFFEKMLQLDEDEKEYEDEDSDNEIEDEGEEVNSDLCMICITNNKSTLLEPCNHLKFCKDCVETLVVPTVDAEGNCVTPTCPECDIEITGQRIVYF